MDINGMKFKEMKKLKMNETEIQKEEGLWEKQKNKPREEKRFNKEGLEMARPR